jgi:hypothetical protein
LCFSTIDGIQKDLGIVTLELNEEKFFIHALDSTAPLFSRSFSEADSSHRKEKAKNYGK